MSNPQRDEWYRQRIAAIHDRVTAYDVLRAIGVELRQSTDDRQEQFSCPFHGADNKPSARVYPEDTNSKSHAWCYVCQEPKWDVIGLWRKHTGLAFGEALSSLERNFGLEAPPIPRGFSEAITRPPSEGEQQLELFKKRFVAADRSLVARKKNYAQLNDMVGFLSACSILDKTKYRVDNHVWTPEKGLQVVETLLDRLRERMRKCPEG